MLRAARKRLTKAHMRGESLEYSISDVELRARYRKSGMNATTSRERDPSLHITCSNRRIVTLFNLSSNQSPLQWPWLDDSEDPMSIGFTQMRPRTTNGA